MPLSSLFFNHRNKRIQNIIRYVKMEVTTPLSTPKESPLTTAILDKESAYNTDEFVKSNIKRFYIRLSSDYENVEISLSYYLFVSVIFFIFCVVMLYMIPTLTECWYRSHHSKSFFTNRHKEYVLISLSFNQ